MNRFAALVASLETATDSARRNALIDDYLKETPEPDRKIARDILAGTLKPRAIKLALVRGLADARTDPNLFDLALAYIEDVGETIALTWVPKVRANRDPSVSEIVEGLSTLGRSELPKRIEAWLDACDETGRWALIKLITGNLRLGRRDQSTESQAEKPQKELFQTPKKDRAGTIAAILLYAERTNPRARISPLRCTFGVWNGDKLAPIGHCTVAGEEAEPFERFIGEHTVARFGPVREVRHDHEIAFVAEVSFAAVARTPRRKAGIALRALRVAGLPQDAKPSDAGTLATLESFAASN